ncbi:glucokinase [Ectothiorhodospiraceae bacterium WFHF3C12]|nr:glucokinase [Ectothiorhodospiraceae bacterium WFHF3C12]
MRSDRPILLADIGGTNARFALLGNDDQGPHAVRRSPCDDYSGLTEAAEDYLSAVDGPRPAGAIVAVAGPVSAGEFTLTNSGWRISPAQIRKSLNLSDLVIVNDFVAQAMAVPVLSGRDLRQLGPGAARAEAPVAVIGPGTGLGVASLVRCAGQWQPIEGEGGHVTYSPVTDREMQVAASVRDRYGHCSAERLLSGPGLALLHETLARLNGAEIAEPLEPETVVRRARGGDPRAREAVTLFLDGLATAAGNLVLTLGASGGVYLCGGILPRLGALLDPAAFRRRFEEKGRFAEYLAAIPTYLVTAEEPALRGLAFIVRQRRPRGR